VLEGIIGKFLSIIGAFLLTAVGSCLALIITVLGIAAYMDQENNNVSG